MQRVAFVLILVSLVTASIAAMTAYVPRLEDVTADDGLTLNAPAGRDPVDPEQPLFDPEASVEPVLLTTDVIVALRAAGVERVRVREFAIGKWDLWWLFLLSTVVMAASGLVIRKKEQQEMGALLAAGQRGSSSPEATLRATRDTLRTLTSDLSSRSAEDQFDLIIERVGALQQSQLADFVAAKPQLIAQLGMAGYARVMDRFAAGERQINRAWSAAADRDFAEALASLQNAAPLIEEALVRLDGASSASPS